MTGRPNWAFLIPAGLGLAAAVVALMAGAHAIGKWRQRRVWLKGSAS